MIAQRIAGIQRVHRRVDAHNNVLNIDCWYCECHDQSEFPSIDEHDAHVAAAVVAELQLTFEMREGTYPNQERYVTPWTAWEKP